jgi:glutathione synthase/RimK-type ligase-like ATP-grasp enzyme
MKKIAIFLKEPNITDYPLSKDDYHQSYWELTEEIKKAGGDPYIVRGQVTYLGNGKFSKSWKYDGLDNYVETGELQADVIFDRGEFEPDHTVPVMNPEFVNTICTDKWAMYQLVPQYCPKTFRVESQTELQSALQQLTTELAVVKPIDGQEGKGVVIQPVAEMINVETSYPALVQEFLDSSVGVPGIVEGLHDFRIAMINGEIIYSYFRTPPTGSYLANVARGGKFAMVELDRIPAEMKKIALEIDQKMAEHGPRFYGVDFAMTKEGPRIIEMNSRLGLMPNRDDAAFVRVKQLVAATLVAL